MSGRTEAWEGLYIFKRGVTQTICKEKVKLLNYIKLH